MFQIQIMAPGKMKGILGAATLCCALTLVSISAGFADDTTIDIFDNLVPVEDAEAGMAYIDPNADFSVFKRVMILEPTVAFRSNWQLDQNRKTRRNRVTNSDMEKIKSDTATMLRDAFIEQLQADGGFEVVEESGDDVLQLRLAIIDLDLTAPDQTSPTVHRTYTTSGGAATLYIELYDSVSGQIIGKAANRQVARNASGTISWSNRIVNSTEAQRIFREWADALRAFLEQHYSSK